MWNEEANDQWLIQANSKDDFTSNLANDIACVNGYVKKLIEWTEEFEVTGDEGLLKMINGHVDSLVKFYGGRKVPEAWQKFEL